ncbi:hypothetical protein AB0L40_03905 [Patulibacter sp. NPDC049589]|uniref:hypothetical protein n=1 Tax=Patulibacter sp. NPDC049589 TaxID=3154731 RepID=UPI00342F55ED
MNTSSPAVRRPRPATLRRRAGVVLGVLGCSLVAVSSAQGAVTIVGLNVEVFPVDRYWDGIDAADHRPDSGAYSGRYDIVDTADADTIQETVQQVRAGVVIDQQTYVTPGATPQTPVVTVLPGDVFRLVNLADGSVLAQTTFTGVPSITSSVLGQGGFAGTRTADATSTRVELLRRIDKTNTSRYRIGGEYTWDGPVPKADPSDPDYDISAREPDDYSSPDTPPAPPAGQQYRLRLVTPGRYQVDTYRTNQIETVVAGRLTSLGDTTFTGAFAVPMAAGDLVEVSQTTDVRSPTLRSTVNLTVATPAGVVPPPDVAAPKVTTFDIAASGKTVAQFLKTGLTSFVALDEAGTVEQQLQVVVKAEKKKAKKAKKAKKGKKPPRGGKGGKATKAATRAAAKPKVVVLGVGRGTVSVAGGTARSKVLAAKGAKGALAKLRTTAVSATLVTTVKDAAGNAATTTKPVRLSENTAAKKAPKKRGAGKKQGSGKGRK